MRLFQGRATTIAALVAVTFGTRLFPADTVEFVRPGLILKINSAKISADGTITTTYSVADPKGLPLDASGISTPGTLSLSFVAAVLPNNATEYNSYTTRVGGTPNQPGADSGGLTTNIGPGQYQYVFNTKAPTGFDATATHTIGIYGSRVLTDYNLGTNFASATYNFVPTGANVTKVHDIIKTASCNSCHDQLSWHGGRRRGIEMCVLCHTTQNVDTTGGLAQLEGYDPRDPYGKRFAKRRCGKTSYRQRRRLLKDRIPWRSATLRNLSFANDGRRTGDRIPDQSFARGLRRLPQ